MTKKEFEALEEKVAIFKFGMIQNFLIFIDFLKQNEISITQIRKLVEYRKEKIKERLSFDRKIGRCIKNIACHKCGSHVGFMRVNISDRDRVGGGYRTLMYCHDWENCGYEHYSKKDIIILIKEKAKRMAELKHVKEI